MKKRLSIKKRAIMFFSFLTFIALLLYVQCSINYPEDITIFKGESLRIGSSSPYSLSMPASFGGVLSDDGEVKSDSFSAAEKYVTADTVGQYSASVRLFGVIPVKSVSVNVSDQKQLIPSGEAIGIKLFTEGLLCVGVSDVADKSGHIKNPASSADIKAGDILISANGIRLDSTEQLESLVKDTGANNITLTIERGGKLSEKSVTPVITGDGPKIGIWVRDSTAGIGTLSFADPETGKYGALGHPICDSDTGMLMPVSSGTVLRADIFGIQKGEKGSPGELKGTFSNDSDFGTIEKNSACGIYGKIISQNELHAEDAVPMASKNAVKKGKAQIISNISGKKTEMFDIEIQRILTLSSDDNKNMVIKVTDEDLLSKTGGIVQGMSGSPIVQNGKLVGAVTHVFVNDPTRGYGIFIENMLSEAEKIK